MQRCPEPAASAPEARLNPPPGGQPDEVGSNPVIPTGSSRAHSAVPRFQTATASLGCGPVFIFLPIRHCVPRYDVGAGLCPGPLFRKPLPNGRAQRPAPARSREHKSELEIIFRSTEILSLHSAPSKMKGMTKAMPFILVSAAIGASTPRRFRQSRPVSARNSALRAAALRNAAAAAIRGSPPPAAPNLPRARAGGQKAGSILERRSRPLFSPGPHRMMQISPPEPSLMMRWRVS